MKRSKLEAEFEDFLYSEEVTPSTESSKAILNQARRHLTPSLPYVSFKYGLLFLLSIFVSLSLCPQSGVSILRKDYPLFYQLFHQNIVLCGVYCASVFFFTTHVLAFVFLGRFEKKIFSLKLSLLPPLFLAISFGALMLMSPRNLASHFWTGSYVVTWLTTSALLFWVWRSGFQKLSFKNTL